MRQIPFRSLRWLTALLMAGAFAAVGNAQEGSTNLQEISRLAKQGQRSAAIAKLNDYLQQHPKDLSGRFMKGVFLVEQAEQSRSKDAKEARDPNRYREAISVFYGIIKDHPERPEPYNNLAAIYASLDQWDKSKEMLEAAIHTNPSYATAHENLGDVYAKLASQAYEKALQLDTSSQVVQNKLRMIGDLFPGAGNVSAPARSQPQKTVVAAATPSRSQPSSTAPSGGVNSVRSTGGAFKPTSTNVAAGNLPPAVVPPVEPSSQKLARADKTAKKNDKADSLKQAASEADDDDQKDTTGKEANTGERSEVLDVVKSWAGAWSKQDIGAYLGHYDDGFKPSSGQSRTTWQKQREARVSRPKTIQVDVVNAKVKMTGNQATVTFRQTYKSDLVGRDSMTKRLVLVKQADGRWRIVRESGR
ncbi:MAG: tetratricopeptide repeat protein [Pseudomonadota bacterium]